MPYTKPASDIGNISENGTMDEKLKNLLAEGCNLASISRFTGLGVEQLKEMLS